MKEKNYKHLKKKNNKKHIDLRNQAIYGDKKINSKKVCILNKTVQVVCKVGNSEQATVTKIV